MTRLTPSLLLLLVGCALPEPRLEGETDYIAPAHRQTRVSPDLVLLVAVRDLAIPPGYPVGPLLHVTDVATEEPVPGEVVVEPGVLLFHPDAPWSAGHRYLWTVDVPENEAHGPEFGLPSSLVGSAVFEVDDRLEVIGSTLERTTEPCFVFSQRIDERPLEAMELRVEGQPIELLDVFLPDGQYWREPYMLFNEDEGLDMVCMETADLVSPDVPVTLGWEGDEWTLRMERRRPGDLVAHDLRRAP